MAQEKPRIHPTALIDPQAELADDVEVGPYSVIGPFVKIGAGTVIASHVVIEGRTTIGERNRIAPFNSIGGVPQDKKYAGEPTRLEIGNDNVIREYGTFNLGTEQGGGVTRIGDDNWIMGYIHVAHDCRIGNHTIFANKAQIAGHVEIGDWAILGGDTGVHQFVRVGAHAFTAFGSLVRQDVPPFTMIGGEPPAPHGINVEGLKRRGFDAAKISALRQAYKSLYRSGLTLEEARTTIEAQANESTGAVDELRLLNAFLGTVTRGITR